VGVRQFGQVLENPTLSETLVPLVPCLPEVRWTHLIEFRARDLKLARPLIFVLLIATERRRKRTWCSRLRRPRAAAYRTPPPPLHRLELYSSAWPTDAETVHFEREIVRRRAKSAKAHVPRGSEQANT